MTPHLVVPHSTDATVDRELPAAASAQTFATIQPSRLGRSPERYLPQVAIATGVVAVVPVVAVWLLRSAGVFRSPWVGLVLAIALSSLLSSMGCAYWKRRKTSGDLLFSELLLWGWLQRWRAERQLASSVHRLGLHPGVPDPPAPPVGDRERLFRQIAEGIEAQDPYTRGHSARVARYSSNIARKMGLAKGEVEKIRAAALVHDVGKLLVPPEILNKPGRLTEAEFAVIRRHPVDGAEMLSGLGDNELTAIVRRHHERLDGQGYPDGLTGEEIPLGARIIAVADTFDAITSVRPYRPRSAHKTACDILVNEQGSQLDRDAVRAFLICYSGRRSIALWSIVATVLQRVGSMLTGQASAATITAGNVVATTIATVAIGGVAMAPPLLTGAHPSSSAASSRSVAESPGGATLVEAHVHTTGAGAGPGTVEGAPRGNPGSAGHVSSAVTTGAQIAHGVPSAPAAGTTGSGSGSSGRAQHRPGLTTGSGTASAPNSRSGSTHQSAPGAGSAGSQSTGNATTDPPSTSGTGTASNQPAGQGSGGGAGGAQGNRGVGQGDGGGAQGNRGVGQGDGGGAEGNRGVGQGNGGGTGTGQGAGVSTSGNSSGDSGHGSAKSPTGSLSSSRAP